MALIGGLVLLIGSFMAFGLSRTIARPVRQLVQGAEQIGQGNLDAHKIECSLKHRDGRWLQFEVQHTDLLHDEHDVLASGSCNGEVRAASTEMKDIVAAIAAAAIPLVGTLVLVAAGFAMVSLAASPLFPLKPRV